MVTIRPAQAADAPALADLARELGHATDAAAVTRQLRAIAAAHAGAVLVAVADDGAVCGFAHALPQHFVVEDSFVELATLVVAEAARGRRVGAALLHAVEAWAREHGYATIYVRSNVIRTRAHRFYLREDYVELKRQAVFHKRVAADAARA